jgi:hypothetical protein
MSESQLFTYSHYGAYYSTAGEAPFYCGECLANLKLNPFNTHGEIQAHLVNDHRYRILGLFDAGPKYSFVSTEPQAVVVRC